ncbi:hypothetical protein L5515_008093 [Caenorhabditis briggsae]|uniref:Uncharacterized protein n=1 Tax=Caenorhabditis briggsae TaxID=6238 RepID=A0AAE9JKD6_CAEBR|nr:hypothetical protein L5515_008093 [Caenorhabditis briggsae]
MVPIPLFPIMGGYSIGFLNQFFGIRTHYQMVLTLWCVGNTNTCVFISLLKRHQVVAAIEQKNMLPAPMLKFSQIFSNVLPGALYIEKANIELSKFQKYSSIAAWLSEVKGIAIYDIDVSLNPSFFFLTFGIMSGTFILSTSYAILYTQLYVMLNSIKSKISHKTFKKHSVAIVSTVMQNLVFVIFFVSPIFLLAIVIYTGRDASAACIIMVVIISFHSSVNTLVMCFTFPSFRIAILLFPFRICKNQSRNITIVPPVNNMSGTVQRAKLAVQ